MGGGGTWWYFGVPIFLVVIVRIVSRLGYI